MNLDLGTLALKLMKFAADSPRLEGMHKSKDEKHRHEEMRIYEELVFVCSPQKCSRECDSAEKPSLNRKEREEKERVEKTRDQRNQW